jgi:hypothetical protein
MNTVSEKDKEIVKLTNKCKQLESERLSLKLEFEALQKVSALMPLSHAWA